ncbi:hypothetical protein D3C80_1566530 [compost metagenome]
MKRQPFPGLGAQYIADHLIDELIKSTLGLSEQPPLGLRELLKVVLRDAQQGNDATAERVLQGLPFLVVDVHDPLTIASTLALDLVDIAAGELMNLPNACPSGNPKGNG